MQTWPPVWTQAPAQGFSVRRPGCALGSTPLYQWGPGCPFTILTPISSPVRGRWASSGEMSRQQEHSPALFWGQIGWEDCGGLCQDRGKEPDPPNLSVPLAWLPTAPTPRRHLGRLKKPGPRAPLRRCTEPPTTFPVLLPWVTPRSHRPPADSRQSSRPPLEDKLLGQDWGPSGRLSRGRGSLWAV